MDGPDVRHMLSAASSNIPATPEFRLLLCCSYIPETTQASLHFQKITALCSATGSDSIDWDIFLELVDRHHIPILAHTLLRSHAWEFVPEPIKEKLRERQTRRRLKALNHSAELVRLARLFSLNGIELISLKGPLLSSDLYGDPGLRQSRDLDVMVKPEDLDRADAVLLNEGYRRTLPDFDLTGKQRAVLLFAIPHYTYTHAERRIELELHWKLDRWTLEQVEELWRHSRPGEWFGTCFRRLSEEMLLLVLCDHGSHHQWRRIKWLGDAGAMFSKCSKMDWKHLIEIAERLDLERSLFLTVLLLHLTYEMPIDESLWAFIKKDKKLIRSAIQSLRAMSESDEEYNKYNIFNELKMELYSNNLKRKLPFGYYLNRFFFDIDTWKSVEIPDSMFWVYPFLRFPMWFKRYYL